MKNFKNQGTSKYWERRDYLAKYVRLINKAMRETWPTCILFLLHTLSLSHSLPPTQTHIVVTL